MKICRTCKVEKSLDEFSKDKAFSSGVRSSCKACRKQTRKNSRHKKPEVYREQKVRYKLKNSEKHKNSLYKSIHKITYDEYLEMIKNQENVCKICGASPQGDRFWALDHDHNCCGKGRSCPKCQRGVLCQSCNKILGFAKDNKEVLAKAIEYLEEYERKKDGNTSRNGG